MKKTFKAFWLALLGMAWLFLMASSCHKTSTDPEPDLPPETQTGAGTIGCYINGKPWWPKPFLTLGTKYLEACYGCGGGQSFSLTGYIPIATGNTGSSLTISVPFGVKKGDNEIYYQTSSSSSIFISHDTIFPRGCGNFKLDIHKIRRVTITKLDTVGVGVLSGTFEFTAFNMCGDTLRFTQGRFDY